MEPTASPETLVLLVLAALAAGFLDAIAGGGGLITLPALLAVGLPPHVALGTNKGQSVFGSGAALVRFLRAGLVDRARARFALPLGFAGACGGTLLVLVISPTTLRPVVLVLLIGAAVFVLTHKAASERPQRLTRQLGAHGRTVLAGALALVIGCYDGFFGPGTGTFLIVAFVAFLGQSPLSASADAKVVNFGSNLAAMSIFAVKGVVWWRLALPMAAAQFLGGLLGAQVTIQRGDRLVRFAAALAAIALSTKVAHDLWVSRG